MAHQAASGDRQAVPDGGDVQLHELRDGSRAGVGHVHAGLDHRARAVAGRRARRDLERGRGQLDLGVLDSAVAQPVPEGVGRLVPGVPVGRAGGDDVVVEQVPGVRLVGDPRLGQPPGRFAVSHQDVDQSVAELLAAVRRPDHRRGVGHGPEHVRVGRDDGEHGPRVGVAGGPEDLARRLGQAQVRAVLGLPAEQVRVVAHGDHHDVGGGGRGGDRDVAGAHGAHGEPLGARGVRVDHDRGVVRHAHPPPRADVLQRPRRVVVAVQAEALLGDPAADPGRVGPHDPARAGPQQAGRDRSQGHQTPAPCGDVEQRVGGGRRPVGEQRCRGVDLADVRPGRRRAQRDAVRAVGHVHRAGAEPLGERCRDRHGVRRCAGVPVVQHAVGVRPDDGDRGARCQRQDAVVRQDDDRARDRFACEGAVCGQVDRVRADVRVRVEIGVELAGRQAQLELAQHGPVDVGFVDQAQVEGRGDTLDGGSAVRVVVGERVDAGVQHGGVARDVVGVVALGGREVAGSRGVGHDEQRRRGPAAQLVEELARDVVGAAVDQVVGRHDGAHDTGLDGSAEGGQLVLVQHARP